MDTVTDPTVLAAAAGVLVGVLTGGVMALKAVAPHTKTTLDDKAVALGEKALPYAVRVLEWLRGRVK